MGAHNRTIVCDFEEFDVIDWSLKCQTGPDESHAHYFYHYTKCFIG